MYLYICRQSLGMQFSYPKNKGVMNKIKDGLLKESLFNILSQKKEIICFVLLIKKGCYFYFKSLSERAIIIALTFIKEGYLDKLNLGNLLLLSITFRSVMGFAKHLAITFICGSTLAPS